VIEERLLLNHFLMTEKTTGFKIHGGQKSD
jgi:hypothetical protein